MSDLSLLSFGIGIFALAIGGVYIALREQYLFSREDDAPEQPQALQPAVVDLQRRRRDAARASERRAS